MCRYRLGIAILIMMFEIQRQIHDSQAVWQVVRNVVKPPWLMIRADHRSHIHVFEGLFQRSSKVWGEDEGAPGNAVIEESCQRTNEKRNIDRNAEGGGHANLVDCEFLRTNE